LFFLFSFLFVDSIVDKDEAKDSIFYIQFLFTINFACYACLFCKYYSIIKEKKELALLDKRLLHRKDKILYNYL